MAMDKQQRGKAHVEEYGSIPAAFHSRGSKPIKEQDRKYTHSLSALQ